MFGLLLTFSLLFTSCVSKFPEADETGCVSACGNLRALGCDGAQGNPGGDGRRGTKDDQTCEAACADIVETRLLPIDTACLSTVLGCRAADGC
jgi:hypothetical protein